MVFHSLKNWKFCTGKSDSRVCIDVGYPTKQKQLRDTLANIRKCDFGGIHCSFCTPISEICPHPLKYVEIGGSMWK